MSTTDQHHQAPGPGHAPALRASDAEREAVVARLHDALGEGRLDLAETEARVAAAYAARHRDDLPPLLTDLPDPGPAGSWSGPMSSGAAPPAWAALWVAAVWRTRTTLLGVEDPGTPPSPVSCRRAAVLVAVVLAFLLLCAFLGAALTGA